MVSRARPVVLGVSGASGQPLAERALGLLLAADWPVEIGRAHV